MKPALKKTFSAIIIALASLVIVIGIASLAMIQDGTSILPGQDDATTTPTLAIITEVSGIGGTDDTGGTDGSGSTGGSDGSGNADGSDGTDGSGSTGGSDGSGNTDGSNGSDGTDGSGITGGSDGSGSTGGSVGSGGSTGSTRPTEIPESSIGDQTATPPSVISCETPEGWMPIIVMPDQTLEQLAPQYGTTSEMLIQGNCLKDENLTAGTILFVPAKAAQSNQTVQCGPPAGWVIYYVQPGDTLYGIATMFGTTVNQLVNANCLNTTFVYSGQRLYVPPYYAYPVQPIIQPTPWITIPDLLTPEVPYLPTGIPFPILPPSP